MNKGTKYNVLAQQKRPTISGRPLTGETLRDELKVTSQAKDSKSSQENQVKKKRVPLNKEDLYYREEFQEWLAEVGIEHALDILLTYWKEWKEECDEEEFQEEFAVMMQLGEDYDEI